MCDGQFYPPEREIPRAAGIHRMDFFRTTVGARHRHLEIRDDSRARALRDGDRIAHVILVPVRNQDEIALYIRRLHLRQRIAGEERINEQPVAGSLDEKTGMAEIGKFH
jgi:hypothetical protein